LYEDAVVHGECGSALTHFPCSPPSVWILELGVANLRSIEPMACLMGGSRFLAKSQRNICGEHSFRSIEFSTALEGHRDIFMHVFLQITKQFHVPNRTMCSLLFFFFRFCFSGRQLNHLPRITKDESGASRQASSRYAMFSKLI
jgi:hypothetical protein